MNLALLASLIALSLIVSGSVRTQNKRSREREQSFWERETRANSVRRKSLDGLPYVRIPLEAFPTHLLQENETVLECISIIEALTSQKIVNFTGYTNTDLKLEYGTANITELSEYDQNYTVLVRTLQKWADILLENGYAQEAVVLMEFAVSTGTDISRTYYALAEYRASRGEYDRIEHLTASAEALHSSNKKVILRHLRANYPPQ